MLSTLDNVVYKHSNKSSSNYNSNENNNSQVKVIENSPHSSVGKSSDHEDVLSIASKYAEKK